MMGWAQSAVDGALVTDAPSFLTCIVLKLVLSPSFIVLS